MIIYVYLGKPQRQTQHRAAATDAGADKRGSESISTLSSWQSSEEDPKLSTPTPTDS